MNKRTLKLLIIFAAISLNSPVYSQWSQLTGYPSTYTKDIINDDGIFYACSLNNGVYRSTDSGISWEQKNNDLINTDSKRIYDINMINGKLFIATVDGIYVSSNNGDNWAKKSDGLTIGPGANNIFAYSIYHLNGKLFSGIFNGIYVSTNNGDNWMITNISGQHTDIFTFTNFHGALYAGRDAINFPAAYKSTDDGFNWSPVLIWNTFPLSAFCFYIESDTLFAGTGHGMWLTTNDGLNWTMRNNGLSSDPYVSSIVKSGNTMIASLKFEGSGVFKSFNNGLNWIEITDNLPFINEISKLLIFNNFIYAATSNGIFKRNLNEIITEINSSENKTPDKISLSQNYPNPFNPVTNLEFGITKPGFVSLKIYDALGKESENVVNEFLNPGIYIYEFDAFGYASGVYYYSIFINGSLADTKRMVLMK